MEADATITEALRFRGVSALRRARDGVEYTLDEFIQHYGTPRGYAMWAEARDRDVARAAHALTELVALNPEPEVFREVPTVGWVPTTQPVPTQNQIFGAFAQSFLEWYEREATPAEREGYPNVYIEEARQLAPLAAGDATGAPLAGERGNAPPAGERENAPPCPCLQDNGVRSSGNDIKPDGKSRKPIHSNTDAC